MQAYRRFISHENDFVRRKSLRTVSAALIKHFILGNQIDFYGRDRDGRVTLTVTVIHSTAISVNLPA